MGSSGCGHMQVSGHQVTLRREQCGLQLGVEGWQAEASSDHWDTPGIMCLQQLPKV